MANYIQKGANIDYVNSGTEKIAAGDVVSLTTRVAVAATDINAGETGTVATEGVFSIGKTASLAIEQGAAVYFNTDTQLITTTDTDVPAGWAVAAADAADAEVLVKIG